MDTADAVVIGGGIAGVSIAAELAESGLAVTLLEGESTLAFHTTGRSAAQYLINYGNDVVRRLTIASAPFFAEGADDPLWSIRPFMRVGRDNMVEILRDEVAAARALSPVTEFLDGDQARAVVSALSPDVAGALYEPDAMELDVAAIHQTYVQRIRRAGGTISTGARVTALQHADTWTVGAGDHRISTPLVVNAAGAWGDSLGELAGAAHLGLHPLRRTIGVATLPSNVDPSIAAGWPLIGFEDGEGGMDGYCKPEGRGLLISPADETPSPPCDARAEEIDVARALAAARKWLDLDLRHISTSWAGLRTFAGDRSPVAGFDPYVPGFFWMVGQGGYGIQMAPGLAAAAASLAVDRALPSNLAAAGLRAEDLAPDRPGVSAPLTPAH
ncbi:MAG: D-arginine dehydrogenase [Candidatus Aldehydirespiratoraceae bacterium]|jgi:D-arginine dehydrogenase